MKATEVQTLSVPGSSLVPPGYKASLACMISSLLSVCLYVYIIIAMCVRTTFVCHTPLYEQNGSFGFHIASLSTMNIAVFNTLGGSRQ